MATDRELIDNPTYPGFPTVSPSGRYALAWGVPGVTDLSKRRHDGNLDLSQVRNYLVERRTLSIVGTFPIHRRRCRWYDGTVVEYKSGGDHYPVRNHSQIAAFWSRAEDWVLVWHNGVWWYEALYLGYRTAAGFHFIEIGDRVEDAVRAELHRRHTRLYDRTQQADGRFPAVDIRTARFHSSVLTLEVQGGVAKEDGNPLDFLGRVELHFRATVQGIQAKITGLHVKSSRDGYW